MTNPYVYHNIFVSDAYGNYLHSRISLETFTVKPSGWQFQFTSANGETSRNFYICFGMTAGDQFLAFLFDTDIKINAKTPFEEYLPNVRAKNLKKSSQSYQYIDLDDMRLFLDLAPEIRPLEFKSNLISSIVYQFTRDYVATQATLDKNSIPQAIGTAPVILTEAFLNLYEHKVYRYSIERFKQIFNVLNFKDGEFVKITPLTLSQVISEDPQFNGEYSPKQFYYTFLESLKGKADQLRLYGLITNELENRINDLEQFSDDFIGDLYDNTIPNERDRSLITTLDSILSEIFGYSGYTILKCGLFSLSLDNLGYNIYCFALDAKMLGKIIHKTHVSPISTKVQGTALSEGYFNKVLRQVNGEKYHILRSFFVEIFLSGYKQTFTDISHNSGKLHLKSDNNAVMLDSLLYPLNRGPESKYLFTSNEYNRYLNLFAKETASTLIVSGRNLIYRKICLMLEDQITPYKIIKHYSEKILEIQQSLKISSDEAIRIIKNQLIDYYSLHYLSYLYKPTRNFNYFNIIRKMLIDGVTQQELHNKEYSDAVPVGSFIKEFDSLIFDLSYFNEKELLQIVATIQFSHLPTQSTRQSRYKPSWTLSLDSILSELKTPIIRAFDLLRDIFNNYPADTSHFSVQFHRAGPGGIYGNSRLHIDNDFGLDGNRFTIDRSDPQSVLDGITSIIYYTLKYNALAIIKEGVVAAGTDQTVLCLNQLRIYHPGEVVTLGSTEAYRLVLSSYSANNYESWESVFNDIFSINTVHAISLFHDASAFGYRLVRLLNLYKNEDLGIYKLL